MSAALAVCLVSKCVSVANNGNIRTVWSAVNISMACGLDSAAAFSTRRNSRGSSKVTGRCGGRTRRICCRLQLHASTDRNRTTRWRLTATASMCYRTALTDDLHATTGQLVNSGTPGQVPLFATITQRECTTSHHIISYHNIIKSSCYGCVVVLPLLCCRAA